VLNSGIANIAVIIRADK